MSIDLDLDPEEAIANEETSKVESTMGEVNPLLHILGLCRRFYLILGIDLFL